MTMFVVLLVVLVVLTSSPGVGFGMARPEFVVKPTWPNRSYYDEDGPEIELDCRVTDASHTLVWFRDGQLIDTNQLQLLLLHSNQSLMFEDPKQFQSGLYKCIANNTAGSISHNGSILITARKQEIRPQIVETSPVDRVTHAEIGDKVNISCTFDVGESIEALMDLALMWLKEGDTVNDTGHTTYGLNNTSYNNKICSLNIDKLQVSDYGTYECYGENSKGNDSKLIYIMLPDSTHKKWPLSLIVGCIVGGFVTLASIVVIVTILRHRCIIRQKYEELEWMDPDSIYEVPNRLLEYDIFISYSSEDLTWVKDVLFYNLTDQGYQVCIDFKDFTPGVAIAENVMDAIYKSRKTIVLMSKNFLKSMWGQFELQQAHNRAIMQRTDVLILIKYDCSKVPAKLIGKTFLDWSDAMVQPYFWTRLYEACGEPAKFGEQDENEKIIDGVAKKTSDALKDELGTYTEHTVIDSEAVEKILVIVKNEKITDSYIIDKPRVDEHIIDKHDADEHRQEKCDFQVLQ